MLGKLDIKYKPYFSRVATEEMKKRNMQTFEIFLTHDKQYKLILFFVLLLGKLADYHFKKKGTL